MPFVFFIVYFPRRPFLGCLLFALFCYLFLPLLATAEFCGTSSLAPFISSSPLEPVWSAPPSRLGESLMFYTHIPDGEVEAVTRYIGQHIVIHMDRAHSQQLTDAQIRQLGQAFDTTIYPRTLAIIGPEWSPGIDLDPRVHLLLHDVEENGSAQGFGGYFSQVDESAEGFHSNRREMIYLDVFGARDWDQTKLLASLAHEFGHLAHWYQNGGSTDESWLEEGMASFLEWAIYGNIHWIFVDGYFAQPSLSLTASSDFENRYGASFLLLLYLYERYGGLSTVRAISAEDRRGVAGIQAVLDQRVRGLTFPRLLHGWMLANLFEGYQQLPRGKRIAPSSYKRADSYPASWRGTIGEWQVEPILLESLPAEYRLEVETDTAGSVYLADAVPTGDASLRRIEVAPGKTTAWRMTAPEGISRVLLLLMPLGGGYRLNVSVQADAPDVRFRTYNWSAPSDSSVSPMAPVWSEAALSPLASSLEREGFLQTTNHYTRIIAVGDRVFAAGEAGLEEHLLDDRQLRKQRLMKLGASVEAMAASGPRWLYLAMGNRGVRSLDTQTWRMGRAMVPGGHVLDLRVVGNRLYSVSMEEGLTVWDIADPARSERLNGYKPDAASYAVEVVGQYAYLATKTSLEVIDLEHFPLRSTFTLDLSGFRLMHALPYLLLFSEGNVQGLSLTNPAHPAQVFTLVTPGVAQAGFASGNQLFLADGTSGIGVYELDLSPPRLRMRQPFPGSIVDLQPVPGQILLLDSRGRIEGLSVDDVGERLTFSTLGRPQALAFFGDAISMGTSWGHLASFGAPDSVPFLQHQSRPSDSGIRRLTPHEGILYLGTEEGTLLAWDGERVTPVAGLESMPPIQDVVCSGNTCWIAAGDVWQYEMVAPDRWRKIRRTPIEGEAMDLAMQGELVYVAALDGGVSILKQASGENVGRIPAQANAVTVGSGRLCIADGAGLIRIHASDPPFGELAEIPLRSEPIQLVMRGDVAAVLTHESLILLDLAEDRLMQEIPGLVWAEEMAWKGKRIWVADRYGLHRFSVHLPGDPSAVEIEPSGVVPEQGMVPQHPTDPLPDLVRLPAYPNPANPEVWFPYYLGRPAEVEIRIYDPPGRLVSTLELGMQTKGLHRNRDETASWDGRNGDGERVGGGVYFYELRAGGSRSYGRIVLRR